MLNVLQIALGAYYLIYGFYLLNLWLKIFNKDTSLSAKQKFLWLVIFVISASFWPLVVPINYLELLKKENNLDGDV